MRDFRDRMNSMIKLMSCGFLSLNALNPSSNDRKTTWIKIINVGFGESHSSTMVSPGFDDDCCFLLH